MKGGYQILDLSNVVVGNETIIDKSFNIVVGYGGKPVMVTTPGGNSVYAEFSISSSNCIGAYIGSDGHCYTVGITPDDEVTITDKGSAGGGGGSGVSDYDDLSNRPQIGGVTLTGNKTASELGLEPALQDGYNSLNNKPSIGNVTLEGDKTLSQLGAQEALSNGYNDLDHKPQINSVVLSGNKSLDDLGIYISSNYSTTEKVVGTWVDGKPLYQKTIPFSSDTYTESTNRRQFFCELIDDSTITFVDGKGYIKTAGFVQTFGSVGMTQGSLVSWCSVIQHYGSAIRIFVSYDKNNINPTVTAIEGYATIQYTKTTD